MKIVAIFISMVMLLAGSDMCTDEGIYSQSGMIEVNKPGRDDQKEELPCAPFCICLCCVFSVDIPAEGTDLFAHISGIKTYNLVRSESPVAISYSFWQPPQSV